jgi:flavin-binding protein dodecin
MMATRRNCIEPDPPPGNTHKPFREETSQMTDHTYKLLEITGTSTTSVEEAVNNAIAKAGKTLHNLKWFEVTDIRGVIENKAVGHWQITMKVGFTLDD